MEDFRNSLTALFLGLPIAILLSELISLITARLVGIGIIGHRFSISERKPKNKSNVPVNPKKRVRPILPI